MALARAARMAWCAGTRSCSTAAGGEVLFAKDAASGIATITLNAPKRLNALTVDMGDEFVDLVARVKDDMSDVRAVVVTGAGSAFSAGGDLQFLRDRCADTPSRNAAIMRKFYSRFLCVRDLPVPVVAAINGHAIGAGLAFALAADFRIASTKAAMGVTFTRLGLHPGMGSSHFLPKLIGHEAASEMLLTGKTINGAKAAEIGMVGSAVAPEEVVPAAMALAGALAEAGPIAVRSATRTLRLQTGTGLDQALWREADAQAYCYASPDMLEGINAVAEKRTPAFTHTEGYGESLPGAR